MPRTIAWSDGSTWTVDEPTFRRVTQRLDAVRPFIWGLDPIYERWTRAANGDRLDVDDFAPSEDDRAILTAALERATEETRSLGAAGVGIDDPVAYLAFVNQLAKLHQLFMTDVTHGPKKPRTRQ